MLVGGPLAYTLRRSPRSRGLRVVIHPDRGVVVTVPARGRRGWADPERHVTSFLAEREPWLRRHLARQARDRAELEATIDEMTRTIAENAPLTVRCAKLVVGESLKDVTVRDVAATERAVAACFASADYKEGQAAFMEKRKPRFTGA